MNDVREIEILLFSLLQDANLKETLTKGACELCQAQARHIIDILPCTPLQEGLMALSLKDQGIYVAQAVFPLSEHMDIEKFKQAWESVFELYLVLRTRIIPGVRPHQLAPK